jgi:hypothetical protein
MSLTGGKRKLNPTLKAWLVHVEKVAKAEHIPYGKEAMKKAKTGKYGKEWEQIKQSIKKGKPMKGGVTPSATDISTNADISSSTSAVPSETEGLTGVAEMFETPSGDTVVGEEVVENMSGGRSKRRTMRRGRGKSRGRGRN